MNSARKCAKNKISPNAGKKTLDVHHSHQLESMDQMSKQTAKVEAEILAISLRLESIEGKKRDGIATDEDIINGVDYLDKKLDLGEKLLAMKASYDEVGYYTNTADVLFKYYDIVEKGCGDTHTNNIDTKQHKPNTILKYFSSKPIDEVVVQKPIEPLNDKKTNTRNSKGGLLDAYMSVIDDNYIAENKNQNNDTCNGEKCSSCKSTEMTVMNTDGYIFCNACHAMEYIIVDHEKPSYRDPPKEISYFAYKRINHFNEWLSQIQGKETTDIPEEVYDKILLEIRKQRITNMADLNYDRVKSILKMLEKNKYYEHIAHIINHLNGVPMPNLSNELEEKLRVMFRQIQTPFLRHSPPKRKNFLSYSYVIHKMIQLLERDEYLPSFKLLRSREKLAAQDSIWRKICEDLGWQFYASL
jgi:hypothetical protein